MNAVISILAGLLFGAGLAIGGMTDPGKVMGFLDVTGRWDPSLAFVMGVALCITVPTFQLFKGKQRPLFESRFYLPGKKDVDGQLLGGAALFGIGWGLAGFCPGPAIASLYSGSPQIIAFVLAMVAGMWLRNLSVGGPPTPPADEMSVLQKAV